MDGYPEEVKTDRLVLRRWREDDLPAVRALCAEKEFWYYPFGRGMTEEEAERFFKRILQHWDETGYGQFAATLAEDGRLIGYVGLQSVYWLPGFESEVEVGWRLGREHWGRGYATEGARTALGVGFAHLGVEKIIALYEPENIASGRVMERLGMTPAGSTMAPSAQVEGEEIELLIYDMTRELHEEREAAAGV